MLHVTTVSVNLRSKIRRQREQISGFCPGTVLRDGRESGFNSFLLSKKVYLFTCDHLNAVDHFKHQQSFLDFETFDGLCFWSRFY